MPPEPVKSSPRSSQITGSDVPTDMFHMPTDGFDCMAEITETNIEKIAWEELSGLVEKAIAKVNSACSWSQLGADI